MFMFVHACRSSMSPPPIPPRHGSNQALDKCLTRGIPKYRKQKQAKATKYISFFMKAWNPPLRTCCHKGEGNLLKAQREKKIRKIPNTPRSMWKGRAPESGTEEIKVLLMAVIQGWGRDDSKVPRGRQNLRFQGSQLPSQRWTKGISCDWNRWEISCPCLNFCVL